MTHTKTPPRVIRPEDAHFVPRAQDGDMAQLAEICGTRDGTELGAGYARLTNARINWTVKYDEVLVVVEGKVRVHTKHGVLEAGPRDTVWLPEGTELTYEAENALIVWAIHPADWTERA